MVQAMEMGQVTKYSAVDSKNENGQDRNGHARTEAPEPPTRQQGAAPEEFERLIKSNHASYALNMSKKQKKYQSQRMRRPDDPSAGPFATHKPRPVPVHCQQEVKKGLDKDVAMKVLMGPLMNNSTENVPMHITTK